MARGSFETVRVAILERAQRRRARAEEDRERRAEATLERKRVAERRRYANRKAAAIPLPAYRPPVLS